MPRRVVMTGMGVVTPIGIGRDAFWDSASAGRSGAGPITRFDASPFPTRIAAEVKNFDPRQAGLSDEQIERSDRTAQFALACTYQALQDSGLELKQEDPSSVGVCISTAIGANTAIEQFHYKVALSPPYGESPFENLDPKWYSQTGINRASIEVAQAVGAHNMCSSVAAACASGSEAAGMCWRTIRAGQADIMFCGGTDAAVNPGTIAGFCAMGALTRRNEEPTRACRPFDAERDGFLIAEGAGVVVLEELEHARARGAHIYAEVAGYASTSNAYHMAALPPEGASLARALLRSLQRAGLRPEHIGYINAHGTSTGQNDAYETLAFKEAFGDQAYRIPVSSTKSMTGHSQGGISSTELALCALALEHDLLPPTINYEHPDPGCDLDYIPNVAREAHINATLSDANGFGGLQSAVVLVRHGWQPS